jgi:endoglucanase
MIARRTFLAGLAMGGALAAAPGAGWPTPDGAQDPLLPLWRAWKAIHVSSAGRIIDRLQDNVSHSEGQGYALVIAGALGDRAGFDLILDWTLRNLAVRESDTLLAWRWHPAGGGGVTDRNNASDGDLFTAWALIRAAERFKEPRYRKLGEAMAADIVRLCVTPWPGREDSLLLLPGVDGFFVEDGYVINPAYYMLRAMADLGEATGAPELGAIAADGDALLASLARERLVPDWVRVTPAGFAPAEGKSSDFGYEAMRVPLYLVWSRLPGHAAVTRARDAYLAAIKVDADETPTVIDPATGKVRETSPDPGYRALAAITACSVGINTTTLTPAFSAHQAYYPGVLQLLSLLAQRETNLGCSVR